MDKLLDALRLIEKHADNFTTHWIDDDSEEEHAAAEKAQGDIAEASAAIKAAFDAQRAMLAALKDARPWLCLLGNYIGNGVKEDRMNCGVPIGPDERCNTIGRLNAAIAQAEAAGIGEK